MKVITGINMVEIASVGTDIRIYQMGTKHPPTRGCWWSAGTRCPRPCAPPQPARKLWVPAVNSAGAFGRWTFLEIRAPGDAEPLMRDFLRRPAAPTTGTMLDSSSAQTQGDAP